MSPQPTQSGLLFILSGPAGSGKTTICDALIKTESIARIITSTTRKPRSQEVDGVDYHFLSHADFQEKIDQGCFFEYATVHNHFYGTQKAAIIEPLMQGQNLLLNIDVQGAKTIAQKAEKDPYLNGKVVTVFIKPPNIEELEKRLLYRATDSVEEIKRRLEVAKKEIEQQAFYHHVIISGSKEDDLKSVCKIYQDETALRNS